MSALTPVPFFHDGRGSPLLVGGFDPGLPGHYLMAVVNRARPTRERPLVLALDEFDRLVDCALAGSSDDTSDAGGVRRDTREFPPPVSTKGELSAFMDRLAEIPHSVVLLTSNRGRAWWRHPERRFAVRPGRVSTILDLDASGPEEAREICLQLARSFAMPGDVEAEVDGLGLEGASPTIAMLVQGFKSGLGDWEQVRDALTDYTAGEGKKAK